MLEIPEPPDNRACTACMRPLLWLWSARTTRWVSFVPDPSDTRTLHVHECAEGGDRVPSWRDFTPRFTEPDPAAVDRVRRGAAMASAAIRRKRNTEVA